MITIYPNPFNDFTTINFGTVLKGENQLILYNNIGQEIYRKENITGTELILNRENLEVGVYLLTFIGSNNAVLVDKLIVY